MLLVLGAAAAPAIVELGEGALAYVPRSLEPDRPAPLLVLLHGAGGRPRELLAEFADEAERHGVVLLGPASKASSWDLVTELAAHRSGPFRPSLAVDPPRVRAAVAALGERVPLDPRRTAIGGFSDGASYALTLGLREPRTFRAIIAFSPGFAVLPDRAVRGQRVFVAHGRQDRVLPFRNTAEGIVPQLRAGVTVSFRPFSGGHAIPPAVQEEGIAFLAR